MELLSKILTKNIKMAKQSKIEHNIYLEMKEKICKILFRILGGFLFFCLLFFLLFSVSRCYQIKYVYPLKYKETVVKYADYYDLDRAIVFAVINTESSFDVNAKSKAGAMGLMQITEKTADYIAKKKCIENYDIMDIETNVNFGCYYIKYLFNKFGDLDTALIAYNAGEGNVAIWLKDRKYSIDGKTLKTTPFRESNEYIIKIHKNFEKYKKLYKKILDK